MRRTNLFLVGLTGVATCVAPVPSAVRPAYAQGLRAAPCTSSANTRPLPRRMALRAGVYQITLAATRGPRSGEQAVGTLWLVRTSGSDSSPRFHTRPTRYDSLETPLYGALDLDFAKIGATVFPTDTMVPRPSSRDPVRPGVLVMMQNWQHPQLPHVPMLLVGSFTNIRDEPDGLVSFDGPGIVLVVRRVMGVAFTGTWEEAGRNANPGSGFFCADSARQGRQ